MMVRGGRSGIGPNERRWGAFICATSADGLTWNVVSDRPMNAGGERFEVSGLYRFSKLLLRQRSANLSLDLANGWQ